MKIKLLAQKECANYFNGKCIAQNKDCWVSEARCGYFETTVIPGVDRSDHPDYTKYKSAIVNYRNNIQYVESDIQK